MFTYFTLNIAFNFLYFGFTEGSFILGTHICANWQERRVVPLLAVTVMITIVLTNLI